MKGADDAFFMREALKLARLAFEKGEVPVGCVIVSNQMIVARSHNQVEQLTDATAHAEMLAITSAENHFGAKILDTCTLYVTLEPCLMCAGAIQWAQIKRVVYGARDNKKGYSVFSNSIFPKGTVVLGNVLAEESEALLKTFFSKLRN